MVLPVVLPKGDDDKEYENVSAVLMAYYHVGYMYRAYSNIKMARRQPEENKKISKSLKCHINY